MKRLIQSSIICLMAISLQACDSNTYPENRYELREMSFPSKTKPSPTRQTPASNEARPSRTLFA